MNKDDLDRRIEAAKNVMNLVCEKVDKAIKEGERPVFQELKEAIEVVKEKYKAVWKCLSWEITTDGLPAPCDTQDRGIFKASMRYKEDTEVEFSVRDFSRVTQITISWMDSE